MIRSVICNSAYFSLHHSNSEINRIKYQFFSSHISIFSLGKSAHLKKKMGALGKVVDAFLLLTFLTVAVGAPVLDAQVYLPQSMFPDMFVRFRKWFTVEHQDYFLVEKPHFFSALMMLELVFQWPLALLNIYGLLTSKPWFNTTCITFGASFITSMTALLGDMIGSKKASDKMLMTFSPYLATGVLALLRGLVSQCSKASPTIGNGPTMARKKIV